MFLAHRAIHFGSNMRLGSSVNQNSINCVPVNCVPVNCVPVNCVRVNCVPVNCVRVNCVPVNCFRVKQYFYNRRGNRDIFSFSSKYHLKAECRCASLNN